MGFDVGGIAMTAASGALAVASGATSWMKVNNNGILTRPQTPFMRGQLTGQTTPYMGSPAMVTADVNIGGHWNNATGRFTCPVTGFYLMTGAGIAQSQAGYFYIGKNGATVHFTHWNHMSSWHYVSLSGVVYCVAGDWLYYQINGTTPVGTGFYGAGGHGMYSIALMA